MHVAVIGAGAIGTVLAAAACETGHAVTVCTRTPLDTLILERDGTEQVLPVTLVNDAAAAAAVAGRTGPAAVIWVATKVGDTAGTAPWLDRFCGDRTLVAAAQNGLDHHGRLLPFVRSEWVVPALAYIAAERVGPGRVAYLGGDRIVVPKGEAEILLAAAVADGLVVRGTRDIWTATWRKLLGNLIANPITTLTMRRIGVMADPGIAALARGLLVEAVEVGRAEGASLGEEDVVAVLTGTSRYGDQTGSSMLYDRMAGRPLEHRHLTGEVVRRAERHGIPVPLNAAILALLDALDRGPAESVPSR
jgi:2-dehydropantoate 2-reductase